MTSVYGHEATDTTLPGKATKLQFESNRVLILQVPSSAADIGNGLFFPDKSPLQPEGLLQTRGMAGSGSWSRTTL